MTGFDRIELREAVRQHGTIARIVITGHKGSTPRETGVSMHVWADGQSGTIGGGALELAAVDHARKGLESGPGVSTLNLPLGPGIGQCCGGAVNLVIENIDEAALDELDNDSMRVRMIRPFRETADSPDKPPPRVQRVVEAMRSGTKTRSTRLIDGWLIEPSAQPERNIWIYGAGHVGRSVVEVLSGLPFAITWVDFETSRFPGEMSSSVRPLVTDPNSLHATGLAPDDADHLVMTHTHSIDLDICNRVLRRQFRSLGLIGSRTKRQRFAGRLRSLGHSDEMISRLTCPIGIPGLGKHPRAIAVGVAAAYLVDAPNDIGTLRIGDIPG